MNKGYTVPKVLDYIFGHGSDPEGREENEAEGDEDEVLYDSEQGNMSDDEDSDVTDAVREIFKSRKGDFLWSSSPLHTQCMAQRENILKMIPGPTRCAVSHAQDIKSTFDYIKKLSRG